MALPLLQCPPRAGEPILLSRKAYAGRYFVLEQRGSRFLTYVRNRYSGAIGVKSHFQWETGGLEANLGEPITLHLPRRCRPRVPDRAAPDHRMARPLLPVPFGLVESPAPAGGIVDERGVIVAPVDRRGDLATIGVRPQIAVDE